MTLEYALKKWSRESSSYGLIARFLLEQNDINEIKMKNICDECFVSPPTIVRFSHKLGFNSFSELKYELAKHGKDEETIFSVGSESSIVYWSSVFSHIDNLISKEIVYLNKLNFHQCIVCNLKETNFDTEVLTQAILKKGVSVINVSKVKDLINYHHIMNKKTFNVLLSVEFDDVINNQLLSLNERNIPTLTIGVNYNYANVRCIDLTFLPDESVRQVAISYILLKLFNSK